MGKRTEKEAFEFANIPRPAADQAFAFHDKVAKTNGHIWPRTKKDIFDFCENGALFGARRKIDEALVAICYVAFDKKENAWEVGGLTVEKEVQNLGIGTVLVKMAIAHTLVLDHSSEHQDRKIIAHVHEANEEPRKLLEKMGFKLTGKVKIPASAAPPTMKRNADGTITGDAFELSIAGVKAICIWLDTEFDGSIGKGKAEAHLNFGPGTNQKDIVEALTEVISDLEKK